MNESEKNIETCLPESILAEVASVPTDPQFVSLVNESLDPLKQQAVQQAGSDAYNEVVASHQPYTFTSQVAQMKSNLILLLRRFWRFPFGSGTIRSLSDMWAHYISRLQGSETYGIPSRLDQLTDLPSAPLLVADRKISGVPDAPDGMSVAQLLCSTSAASSVTEIVDDNTGWAANKSQILRDVARIFTNLQKITLNCESITTVLCGGFNYIEMNNRDMIFVFTNVKSIPNGQVIGDEYTTSNFRYTEVHIHGLETTNQTNNTFGAFRCNKLFFYDYKVGAYRVGGSASFSNSITQYIYIACLGNKTDLIRFWCDGQAVNSSVNDIEVRDGMCQSFTIQNLNGLTAENMYNHILLRLKQDEPNCGSGVTITLGTTNIEKLEAVEEYNTKLTELEDTYGYTFA